MNENPFDGLNRADLEALGRLRRALNDFRLEWLYSDQEIATLYPLGPETGAFETLALHARAGVMELLDQIRTVLWQDAQPALPPIAVELLQRIPLPEELHALRRDADGVERVLWRQAWPGTGLEGVVERLDRVLTQRAIADGEVCPKGRRYTADEKIRAGKILQENPDLSWRALAAATGITHTTLHSWSHLQRIKRDWVSDASKGSGVVDSQFTRDM